MILENEEEFLNLLEKEQKAFHSFPPDTFFDDVGETKLIEDLVCYLPTKEKEDSENNRARVSQKPQPRGFLFFHDDFLLIIFLFFSFGSYL